ncbi:WecB/TagA/CpsF family glycosyltransferase [Limimaricola sp.]|uniref:WecB/TagA/CpsF family glycosyltransferase n=1 Tax=Limimaricola sp. TaxID=2211665 RepID=UPI0025B7EBED|nr:WecB/TagA/CpsF family glycosyltransferase [Limimaricola sp.]
MTQFLGHDFDVASPSVWLDRVLSDHTGGFAYLATPNVDHVVRASRDAAVRAAYEAADWKICDSRVLQRLARLKRLELAAYPGSDLVFDLLHDPRAAGRRIAVLGPDVAAMALLRSRFPTLDLVHIDAPMMQAGSPSWDGTLARTEALTFDILLLCISFPKQEFFAQALKERGQLAGGIGLCVGASLDFLTGRQRRAPRGFRKLGLEWLFRLLSQPRRLWRRYLIQGPRIFVLFAIKEMFH